VIYSAHYPCVADKLRYASGEKSKLLVSWNQIDSDIYQRVVESKIEFSPYAV